MNEWVPTAPGRGGPKYLEIVGALEADIASGRLPAGARLLPHREMAERLGVSIGTVSKAYAEAVKRGLISGEVGRGTFVLPPAGASRKAGGFADSTVNLALNAPPPTGESAAIGQVLAEIARAPGLSEFMGYMPHQGIEAHRAAASRWLNRQGMPTQPASVFLTHGAQHAISIAMSILARPGEIVLAESLTYSGAIALANQAGYNLRGVLMDGEGLIPEELDRALRETGARVVYCMPTLQTPTGAIMSPQRRAELVEIIVRHDAYVVEDDAYGFLCDPPVAPIASILPERSFYIVSFSKCLAPGLRIGAMHVPTSFRDRSINAIRSTGWMATPLMAEVVARMAEDGQLQTQVIRKREIAARRTTLARRILGDFLPPPLSTTPAFHVWLPLPAGRTLTAMIAQAAMAGITIAPPHALRSQDPMANGVRLCLGSPDTDAELERALSGLRSILDSAETLSLV